MSSRLPKLLNGGIERIRHRPQVQPSFLVDRFVNPLSDKWPINIVHGPAHEFSYMANGNKSGWAPHHMVAMTLLNPANSIVAARLIASSGCHSSVLAVSHALRYAS
jgi:hypothetical protein